jgi:hypothetical protein
MLPQQPRERTERINICRPSLDRVADQIFEPLGRDHRPCRFPAFIERKVHLRLRAAETLLDEHACTLGNRQSISGITKSGPRLRASGRWTDGSALGQGGGEAGCSGRVRLLRGLLGGFDRGLGFPETRDRAMGAAASSLASSACATRSAASRSFRTVRSFGAAAAAAAVAAR